jgi:hypothetical protein
MKMCKNILILKYKKINLKEKKGENIKKKEEKQKIAMVRPNRTSVVRDASCVPYTARETHRLKVIPGGPTNLFVRSLKRTTIIFILYTIRALAHWLQLRYMAAETQT